MGVVAVATSAFRYLRHLSLSLIVGVLGSVHHTVAKGASRRVIFEIILLELGAIRGLEHFGGRFRHFKL